MVVFQTANSVRVRSPVVAVVISVATVPPRVRLHPPNEYPVRVVTAVRARDSVETLRESAETLVAVSVAGTVVAKVLPSKTMVGLVEAVADEGIAVSPARARRPVRTMAVVLFVSDMALERRAVDMAFPPMVRLVFLKSTLGL